MIPQSFIQDLLARVDIVDVVERYVPLKRAGANYSACCPFHTEKTPSFTVSPAKQFYHCFGCGAHGSAIGFVMEYSGLGFVDAVKELAAGAGMAVPVSERAPAGPPPQLAATLTEIMGRAAAYYREQLKRSPVAIDYLKSRGLTGEIAQRFGIGYAPEGWQNLQGALAGATEASLLECGLLIENEAGRRYDRFRERIMFPILDARANVIAFGGRIIGKGEPKYLNSPETPLFEKGRELYGLTQARQAIRETGTAIVVEGYMDVVALAQHGVENAVATLGTATTPVHVQKLLRQAGRVVFCFDGDAAGRKAAWRALEASLDQVSEDRTLAFLFLPSAHDPDSYVREIGAPAFLREVGQAGSAMDFLIRQYRERADLKTPAGEAALFAEAKPVIERIKAPRLRAQMAHAVVSLTRFVSATPRDAERMLGLAASGRGAEFASRALPPAAARRAPPPLVRTLLRQVLVKPEWAARLPLELLPEAGAEAAALRALADACDHGELPAAGLGTVLEFFRGSAHEPLLADMVAELANEIPDEESMEAVFVDALDQLRRSGIGQEIAALNAKSRAQGLTSDERRRLAQLLAQKQTLDAAQRADRTA